MKMTFTKDGKKIIVTDTIQEKKIKKYSNNFVISKIKSKIDFNKAIRDFDKKIEFIEQEIEKNMKEIDIIHEELIQNLIEIHEEMGDDTGIEFENFPYDYTEPLPKYNPVIIDDNKRLLRPYVAKMNKHITTYNSQADILFDLNDFYLEGLDRVRDIRKRSIQEKAIFEFVIPKKRKKKRKTPISKKARDFINTDGKTKPKKKPKGKKK